MRVVTADTWSLPGTGRRPRRRVSRSPPRPPPRARHCRSPPPPQRRSAGRSGTTGTSCCWPAGSPGIKSLRLDLRGAKNGSKTRRKPDLNSESARLDAIVPLDGLLLPLVVRDVPRELEHRAIARHQLLEWLYLPFAPTQFLADPGEARGCSINSLVIN